MPLLARLAPVLLLVTALALAAGTAPEPVDVRLALADTIEAAPIEADTLADLPDTLDAEPVRDPALGDTLAFAEADRPPRLVGGPERLEARAEYPPELIEQQTRGLAVVRFVVDETGRPRGLRFVRSAGEALDAEARRLIETAEFEPGRVGRQPVPVQFTLPIRFLPPPRPEPVAGVGLDFSQPQIPDPAEADSPEPESVETEAVDEDAFFEDETLGGLPDGEGMVHEIVEDPPMLIGGLEGLQQRLVYPREARDAGIEGTVIVQFTVHADGSTSGHTCARDPGGGTCGAAIEAVSESRFEPGRARGEPVEVRFSMPIRFRLR